MKQINSIDIEIQDLMRGFPEVFEQRIGCIPNYKVSLKLRESAMPIYNKERQIPYALTETVNKELDALDRNGIITKISNNDWGSPLVVIPKADEGVRLCVDYKVGINQRLIDAHYPIKKIGEVFNCLRDLHVAVDENSSEIKTISTHKDTFKMNRLSFGIKTVPALIQELTKFCGKCPKQKHILMTL